MMGMRMYITSLRPHKTVYESATTDEDINFADQITMKNHSQKSVVGGRSAGQPSSCFGSMSAEKSTPCRFLLKHLDVAAADQRVKPRVHTYQHADSLSQNSYAFGHGRRTLLEITSQLKCLKVSRPVYIVQRLIESHAKPQLLKAARQRHTCQRLVKPFTKLKDHNTVGNADWSILNLNSGPKVSVRRPSGSGRFGYS